MLPLLHPAASWKGRLAPVSLCFSRSQQKGCFWGSITSSSGSIGGCPAGSLKEGEQGGTWQLAEVTCMASTRAPAEGPHASTSQAVYCLRLWYGLQQGL